MIIESYLPVFPGFYWSGLSDWNDEDFISCLEEDGYTNDQAYEAFDFIDYKVYREGVSRACVEAVWQALEHHQKFLQDYGIKSIEFQELYSPKEYNFGDDVIYCKYDIDPDLFSHGFDLFLSANSYIGKNSTIVNGNVRDLWVKWLEDHFTSRDGFASYFSNDADDWKQITKNYTQFPKSQYFGQPLEFIMKYDVNFNERDLLYKIYEDLYLSNYFNEEEFQKKVGKPCQEPSLK